jgi:hypothetical protein
MKSLEMIVWITGNGVVIIMSVNNKNKLKYKHQVGDIITDVKSGKLKILEQIKMIHHRKNKEDTYDKGYKYQCLICGNIDTIRESNLSHKYGCNVCCINPQKILIGYNDMWTTNPKLASLLLNPNDGYKYTQCCHNKVNWKCPNCGNIIANKSINQINRQGLSCPKCGDGISYPEKLMYSVLEQLGINFQIQLSKTTLKWCDKYRYDFYIPELSIIIETHGLQHYKDSTRKGARTLVEEQVNDENKKELALNNGIKEENYIVINCKYSGLEWIKNNILHKLNNIFDLSKIDWLKCHEFACNNLVKQACDLWNSGIYTTIEIDKIMKLDKNTIIRYLKQGTILQWCNYNAE